MNFTAHFTLAELLSSDTAVRLNITEQFNPSSEVIENLHSLSSNILEPLRIKSGKSIFISSGYRCGRLNKIIGGARNSQHITGQAADISITGMDTESAYQYIRQSGILFDQVIQEFDRWVHISYSRNNNRKECLRAIKVNGKTIYKKD